MMRWIEETWIALMADKKKAGVLGGLVLVFAVMGVKRAVELGPSGARASSVLSTPEDEASAVVSAEDLLVTGPVVEVPRALGAIRNLFEYDPAEFPPPAQTEPLTQVPPKSADGTDDTSVASPRALREQLEREVMEDLGGLRLKSTLLGARAAAVIEVRGGSGGVRDEVLRPGEWIAGFVLVSVESDRVLLERSGVRVALRREVPDR